MPSTGPSNRAEPPTRPPPTLNGPDRIDRGGKKKMPHSTPDRPPMSAGADAAFARGLSQSQDGPPLDLPFTCPTAYDAHPRDRRRVAAPLPTPQLSVRTCMTQHRPIHCLTSPFHPIQALSQPAPSQPTQQSQPRPEAALPAFLHPIQPDSFVPTVPCRHTRAQAAAGHTTV